MDRWPDTEHTVSALASRFKGASSHLGVKQKGIEDRFLLGLQVLNGQESTAFERLLKGQGKNGSALAI